MAQSEHEAARDKLVVLIASPLEAEHAARIGAAYPDRVELIYRPDLLPAIRYLGDHGGDPAWRRTASRAGAVRGRQLSRGAPWSAYCPLRWHRYIK